jgi:molybdopterin converting factor small subunit
MVSVKVYKNKSDVRCYYKNSSDIYGYKSFETVRGKFIKGSPSQPFIEVGEFTIECAYDEDKWDIIDTIQAGEFQKNKTNASDCDNETDTEEESGLITKLRPFFGGRYYKRLNKIICRFDNEKAKSGDKSRYPIVDSSRFRITFPETLDEYFAIVVNKSKIDEKNINENVYKTIQSIKNDFITMQYKLSKEEKENANTMNIQNVEIIVPRTTQRLRPVVIVTNSELLQESDSESITESITESVAESVAESVTESVAESVTESVAESSMETTPIVQTQEPRLTENIIGVNSAVTYVGPSMRLTSKSYWDLANIFRSETFSPESIDIIVRKASNQTVIGLTELFRKAIEIEEILNKIKNDEPL